MPAHELIHMSNDDMALDEVEADDDWDDESESDAQESEDRGVELRIDSIDDPIAHLLHGEIEIEGRMPYSSNCHIPCTCGPRRQVTSGHLQAHARRAAPLGLRGLVLHRREGSRPIA